MGSRVVVAVKCSDTPAIVLRQKQIERLFLENGYTVIPSLSIQRQDSVILSQQGKNQLSNKSIVQRFTYNLFGSVVNLRKQLRGLDGSVDYILFSDIPYISLLYLQYYSKKYGVTLLYDCYDWYSSEAVSSHSLEFLESCYVQLMKRFFMICVGKSQAKIIVISTYLQNYFEKFGKYSLRIPIIMDSELMPITPINNGRPKKLTIVYAGNPGKRDYIGTIIETIASLGDDERERIYFIIAGIDIQQLSKLTDIPVDILLSYPFLEVVGKIKRDAVLPLISQADFTILIRSSTARYAKAGFSNKSCRKFNDIHTSYL